VTRDTCGGHALELLTPTERVAYETARALAGRGEAVPAGVAGVLLDAIGRLEHDSAHGHWGALECDREP
jgi:hypothetical protein